MPRFGIETQPIAPASRRASDLTPSDCERAASGPGMFGGPPQVDELSPDVQPPEVVVADVRDRQPVSGEDHGGLEGRRRVDAQREGRVLAEPLRLLLPLAYHRETGMVLIIVLYYGQAVDLIDRFSRRHDPSRVDLDGFKACLWAELV